MTASLETLVIAAYVFAHALPIPRPGPQGKITDAELICLAVAQAAIGESSDRKFLGMIAYRLEGWFSHLPEQSQYNRRLRRLTPYIAMVQLGLAELIASGDTRLADGTLISCANYAGCGAKSHFAGRAGYGLCPSKSRFYRGMRLVLVTDEKGVPLGYDLVAPGEGEREPLFRLAQAHPGTVLFADRGFWGAEYERTIELISVALITPGRDRDGERPAAEVFKATIRLVFESVFAFLKRQMRLEEHLAKTIDGLRQRVAQRLLALTRGTFSSTSNWDGPCAAWLPMTGVEPTSGL